MPSPPAPSVTNDWPQRSKRWPQGLHQAAGEDFELHRLGPELPDAAGVQAPHAVRRFDVAVNVNRLVEVEHAVRPPAEGVEMWCVSSVPKPESTTRCLSALPPPSVSRQVNEFGAVGDVDAAVARLEAGGNEQAVGEDGGLVGLAVALGVFEDDDLVVGLLRPA